MSVCQFNPTLQLQQLLTLLLPLFPPVYIQDTQCPRWLFILREMSIVYRYDTTSSGSRNILPTMSPPGFAQLTPPLASSRTAILLETHRKCAGGALRGGGWRCWRRWRWECWPCFPRTSAGLWRDTAPSQSERDWWVRVCALLFSLVSQFVFPAVVALNMWIWVDATSYMQGVGWFLLFTCTFNRSCSL